MIRMTKKNEKQGMKTFFFKNDRDKKRKKSKQIERKKKEGKKLAKNKERKC